MRLRTSFALLAFCSIFALVGFGQTKDNPKFPLKDTKTPPTKDRPNTTPFGLPSKGGVPDPKMPKVAVPSIASMGKRPKGEDSLVGTWEGKNLATKVSYTTTWGKDGKFVSGDKHEYYGNYEYSKGFYRHVDYVGAIVEGIIDWINENEFLIKASIKGTNDLVLMHYIKK